MRGKETLLLAGLAAAWLAAALAPAPAAAADLVAREFRRTFTVREGDRLVLRHGDGDVRIEPVDGDTLAVEVRYEAQVRRFGFGATADFTVEFAQEGRTVQVRDRELGGGSLGYFQRETREHLYLVRAPAWLELEIEGRQGDVEIAGWRARLTLATDSGDVDLRDVEAPRVELKARGGDLRLEEVRAELTADLRKGDLIIAGGELPRCRLRTDSGDVTIGAALGSLEVESRDGDVTVRAFAVRKLRIETRDGDVDLQLQAPGGLDVEVRTADGDVRMALADGASAAFRLETVSGEIRADLPEAVLGVQEKGRLTGSLGRGEGRLEVRTRDGRITLLPSP